MERSRRESPKEAIAKDVRLMGALEGLASCLNCLSSPLYSLGSVLP